MMRCLLAAALALVLSAGCIQAPAAETGTPAPAAAYAPPAVPEVDAKALLADHAAFVRANPERADNKPAHESARAALLALLEGAGLETHRQDFRNGIDQANIIGMKWGLDRTRVVVVGAHYDTTHNDCMATDACPLRPFSQGAYDDGSGTMMVVHLAKAFARVPTYHSIAFVLFDGEERGTQGSGAFALAAQEGSLPWPIELVAALDLDMIGLNWPGVNAPINLITNSDNAAAAVFGRADAMGFPEGQVIRKAGLELGSSDYRHFIEMGIPTVFLIADFEEVGTPAPAPPDAHTPFGAYPFWHNFDTVETMTAAAGGPDNLEKGFGSAANLSAFVLHLMSSRPEVALDAA